MSKPNEENIYGNRKCFGSLAIFPKDVLNVIVSILISCDKGSEKLLRINNSFTQYMWPTEKDKERFRCRCLAFNEFNRRIQLKLKKIEKTKARIFERQEIQNFIQSQRTGVVNKEQEEQLVKPMFSKRELKKLNKFLLNPGDYFICKHCLKCFLVRNVSHVSRCKGKNRYIMIENVPFEDNEKLYRKCQYNTVYPNVCNYKSFKWCAKSIEQHEKECEAKLVRCLGCGGREFPLKDIVLKHSKCYGNNDMICKWCMQVTLSSSLWMSHEFKRHVDQCKLAVSNLDEPTQRKILEKHYIDAGKCELCNMSFKTPVCYSDGFLIIHEWEKEAKLTQLKEARKKHESFCGNLLYVCLKCHGRFKGSDKHDYKNCSGVSEIK
jgi:hypothetical protein